VLEGMRALRRGESSYMVEGHQAFRAGDPEAAADAFTRALEISGGTSVAALVDRAAAEERLGRSQAALEDLARARGLDPSNATVLFNLGLLLSRGGRAADAEPLLREAVTRSPNDGEAAREWALVLVSLGRFEEAERALGSASLDEVACRRFRAGLALRAAGDTGADAARAALERRIAACTGEAPH
jgi:Flp pilus assembly protein TadD